MALARCSLNKIQRQIKPIFLLNSHGSERNDVQSFSSENSGQKGDEISVSMNTIPRSRLPSRRGWMSWRNDRDITPLGFRDLLPRSGFGNAFLQLADSLNNMFENLSPSQLFGPMKEHDEFYKLKLAMPGVGKEEVKVTIDEGVLRVKGEHREEGESSEDDDMGYRSYGYYNTSLVLPDDAKLEEIKAELKNGVLYLTIPKAEPKKMDVKEVQVL